jgi:SH3-like domain-containing protein
VLPQGAPIEVLINDGEWYLVRSSFGLTGWVRVKESAMGSSIGVYFMGD